MYQSLFQFTFHLPKCFWVGVYSTRLSHLNSIYYSSHVFNKSIITFLLRSLAALTNSGPTLAASPRILAKFHNLSGLNKKNTYKGIKDSPKNFKKLVRIDPDDFLKKVRIKKTKYMVKYYGQP
jgi:hypothetical protein